MLKSFRTAVIVLLLLHLTLSGGVAAADPPNLDDVTDQYKNTADGWRLHVSLTNMSITSVPNMAATAFTREAYITVTAEVWVEALDPDDPAPDETMVKQRSISLWLQEGCQATMGTAQLGGTDSAQAGLSATTGTTGTSLTPSTSQTPDPEYVQSLGPGTTVAKNLQNKAYPDKAVQTAQPPKPAWVQPGWKNDKLTVSLQNWDMNVNGCAGPVSFRFIGEATMSTPHANDAVDAYSAIVQV